MFPSITSKYYTKRRSHLKVIEEQCLRQLLIDAIPVGNDGWSDDVPRPKVIIRDAAITTDPLGPTGPGHIISGRAMESSTNDVSKRPLTPPPSPPLSVKSLDFGTIGLAELIKVPYSPPLSLDPLPRTPPRPFSPGPLPDFFSVEARLTCLARWTHFDPETGAPYLASEPREKKFEMCWSSSGAREEVLVKWVREMWWSVWVRQAQVNYVGMWKKRFEKEDAKAERKRVEQLEKVDAEEEEEEVEARKKKISERLRKLHGL